MVVGVQIIVAMCNLPHKLSLFTYSMKHSPLEKATATQLCISSRNP